MHINAHPFIGQFRLSFDDQNEHLQRFSTFSSLGHSSTLRKTMKMAGLTRATKKCRESRKCSEPLWITSWSAVSANSRYH